MKTANDPRHIKRQKLVKELFKYDFYRQNVSPKAKEIIEHQNEIDSLITKAAPEFPLNKINKVDLSILRTAVFELTVARQEPSNVIIDEAIELAKEFGGDSSPAFVNGVLGNIIKYDQTT